MRIQRPDGSVITFKYDAFGRRISKSYHRREFLYIWDKNVPLHEIQKEELCEDNIITWIFEGFTPTAKLINDKAYSIISDHIGTPLMAIDTQGNKVWERELDIYGRVRKEFTSDDVANRRCGFMPFLYQGQYYDVETELAYNRFRYYSPDTGAYISQDPIGLAGNNPNIYAYVWDTNTWIDIFGLDTIVYQLVNNKDVVYYGITERSELERLREHLRDTDKNGRFTHMEVLAEGLTHDEARSMEGALIRNKINSQITAKQQENMSVEQQLKAVNLLNKNRGRVDSRWTTDGKTRSYEPLEDLKDKILKQPRKVTCNK